MTARTANGHEVSATIIVHDAQEAFDEWEEKFNVDPMKEWTINFSLPLDIQTISEQNVYVTASNGEILPVRYHVDKNHNSTKLLIAPVKEYSSGESYTLWIKDVEFETGQRF